MLIANDIEAMLDGRSSVSCLLAIGMVLGHFEGRAERPDLDGLLAKIRKVAEIELRRSKPSKGAIS